MTTEELLQWADDIVFANTAKHLDSVQVAILEGVWQGLKYEEIAKKCYRSKSHIKNIAAELWQTLSELLGEEIHKTNARSVLERKAISNIYNYGNYSPIVNGYINSHISICSKKPPSYLEDAKHRSPSNCNSPPNKQQAPIIDLTDAPEFVDYYPRPSEESTLKQWILEERTRAIAIYGLSGIGKSALTLKLIEEVQTEFDYIIWKNLGNAPTLSTLKTDLYQFFSRSQQPTPLPTFIDYLRSFRCLVILDDVHTLFQSGQFAGHYLEGYEDYGKFFKKLATAFHHSCLILVGWEKPIEIAALEAEKRPVRSLCVNGLEEKAEHILKEKGLTDDNKYSEIISLYQGHPSWLNIISSTILELFNGKTSLFLENQNEIFLGDLEPLLEAHFQRLSESERKVSAWLASQGKAVDISQTPADSQFSKSEFVQTIQSLIRRCLVEKYKDAGKYMFIINPVFKQYIASKFTKIDISICSQKTS